MDAYDNIIYNEIRDSYHQEGLTSEDYEEIYQRFSNLGYLLEVKPYLYAMKAQGLGTEKNYELVMEELKPYASSDNVELSGLYYDLLLYNNSDDEQSKKMLAEQISKGYSRVYLKRSSCTSELKENNEISERNTEDIKKSNTSNNTKDDFVFVTIDSFQIGDRGTVIVGQIETGIIKKNDELLINGSPEKVVAIECNRKILGSATKDNGQIGLMIKKITKDIRKGATIHKPY